MIRYIINCIPNFITSLNIICGILSIIMAFENRLDIASALIICAAVFDFFDGMSARLLKAYSDIGKQLDSLADMISFGTAPTVIILKMFLITFGKDSFLELTAGEIAISSTALLIGVFSALRLAKFNIDERQTSSFIGLPTPSNAFVILSLPLITKYYPEYSTIIHNQFFLAAVSVVFACMLVTEIPLFSLKFKNLRFNDNKIRFVFIVISLILLLIFRIVAIPIIIVVYILLSVIENIIKK